MLNRKKEKKRVNPLFDSSYNNGKSRKSFLANFCHRQTYFIYLIPAFLLGCLFGYLFFGRVLQSTEAPITASITANSNSDVHKHIPPAIDPESHPEIQEEHPNLETARDSPDLKIDAPRSAKLPEKRPYEDKETDPDVIYKRDSIRNATLVAYTDFERHCHGKDELWPIGKKCHNWVNMGLTTIDSLDTLWIMGYKDEFYKAVDWIKKSLNLSPSISISFFETVIRCLGGLLSAYALSGEQVLLDKAKELGLKLMPAFKTATGLPMGQINVATGKTKNPGWAGGGSLLAEVGTIQLEFGYLGAATGDDKFREAAFKVFDQLDPENPKLPKLRMQGQYPLYISPHDLSFKTTHISWGAMGDSFYEYLLKLWIITGKKHDQYKRMYLNSVEGMFKHLWVHNENGFDYVAELKGGNIQRKMDHLACFTSGLLTLGVIHEVVDGEQRELHKERAIALAETCYNMYKQMKSGLSPEYVTFNAQGKFSPGVDFYLLRPETVESFFLLWRLTKDQKWRDYGWEVFQKIQEHCRVEGAGYVPVLNVNRAKPRHDPQGKMQSFLIAETFKYLFLLFSDDEALDLTEYVFNTEAHPLPLF